MNRHFIQYAALPCEPLGTPKRPEPPKPADGPWKPLRPGYEHRTLAGGATEVRRTDLGGRLPRPPLGPAPAFVEPEKKAGDAPLITPLASSQTDAPEGAPVPRPADAPEGATHTDTGDGEFFRHTADGGNEYWDMQNGGWLKGALTWGELCRECDIRPLISQPTAPTEWQSGPPPERGWYSSSCSSIVDDTKLASFWNGGHFTHFTGVSCGHLGAVADDGFTGFWRGPRLTGADWPEPQP